MNNSHLEAEPLEASPFSIGVVSGMTGIPEATLRIWERRYDFPRSARTAGGHRQYSQQDVLHLHWVKQRMDGGMRASRAIRARKLTTRDAAVAVSLSEPLPPCEAPDRTLIEAQAQLLAALLDYDGDRASLILDRLSATYTLRRIALDVIRPALSAIGDAWNAGEAQIATEHFATNFLRHRLLAWMEASPDPFHVAPIVLACAPDELHEGSLLILGVLLRQLRWPVIYLGQSLPLADIGALASRIQPALIVFVAMSEAAALALAAWPIALTQSAGAQPPIICYGGRAFTENPALTACVPGALLGATLCEGLQRINRLMLDLTVLQN